MGFIYKVTNTVNGKVYIGQTSRTIEARWKEHLKDAFGRNEKFFFPFHKAIKKYGEDAFVVEQLEECDSSKLDERERYWIKHYGSNHGGYNADCGGRSNRGHPIYQYSIDGTFLREFETSGDAQAAIGGKLIMINNREPNNSCSGYLWRRYKVDKLELNRKRHKGQVHQYTLDGKYIKSFDCIADASASCGAKACTLIGQVCKSERRIAFGYRWSYEKVDQLPAIAPLKRSRKVVRISSDGRETVYDTISEAAKENGLNPPNIIGVCKGKAFTCGGYRWRYCNEPKTAT